MSCELADPRAEQVARDGAVAHGDASRMARESADYKRPSVRAPVVFVPMTSAHPCWGRWSRSRAVRSDRCRGFSVRRARASVDHNSRGKKE
jgi:hypothetical protein